ncbi:MAG TPA: hypothetical protein VFE19_03335, partial [Jatrophihabitantaceae bacterium]|nr:hypothetical protein [Jatrophihabitantaceae bacterium]
MSSRGWRWWRALSLRGRITLIATGLFAVAVICGAVITLFVVRLSLTHTLDAGAVKTGNDVATLVASNQVPNPVQATSGGVVGVQVVDAQNRVLRASAGGDFAVSMLSTDQLHRVRGGARIEITGVAAGTDEQLRVLGVPV